jgi:release factor glutamine methyltransferase
MTIKEALLWGWQTLQSKDAHLDSQADSERLLEYVLKCGKTQIFLNLKEKLSPWQKIKYQRLIKKRAKLYPLAYLLGDVAFYNLTLKIKPGVFIPRPETELLVDELLKILKSEKQAVTISEIGIGSGAIALALLHNAPNKIQKYYANDLSLKARQVASVNARQCKLSAKLKIIAGKNLKPLEKYQAQILIANPPYVPYQKYKNSPTIQSEPWQAITDKNDGLDFFRQLVSDLKTYDYYPQIIAL